MFLDDSKNMNVVVRSRKKIWIGLACTNWMQIQQSEPLADGKP